jgi:hypothetical protein
MTTLKIKNNLKIGDIINYQRGKIKNFMVVISAEKGKIKLASKKSLIPRTKEEKIEKTANCKIGEIINKIEGLLRSTPCAEIFYKPGCSTGRQRICHPLWERKASYEKM